MYFFVDRGCCYTLKIESCSSWVGLCVHTTHTSLEVSIGQMEWTFMATYLSSPIQSLFIFCQLETFKISLFWGPVSWVILGKFHWKFVPFTQTNTSKNIFECFAGYEWKFFPHQTLVFSLQSSRLNVINDKCLFYCSLLQNRKKFSLKEEFLKDLSGFLPN